MPRHGHVQHGIHLGLGFPHAEPSHGVAREIQRAQGMGALQAQVGKGPPLHDAEESLIQAAVSGLAARRPGVGAGQRLFVVSAIQRLRAFVQAHNDISPQRLLGGDHTFRGKAVQTAIDVRAERDPIRIHAAHLGQTKDLIAAGIGQNRPWPGHKAVQAAEVSDQFGARPQVQVIGIGQDQAGF
jgi:hypothetical protein